MDTTMCLECYGWGIIITCCDDLCQTESGCIHGDGDEICAECDGEGWIDPDEE